jgi:hypothetical protein
MIVALACSGCTLSLHMSGAWVPNVQDVAKVAPESFGHFIFF